jgi:branched-chain amino acid transport system substrate-binding protein
MKASRLRAIALVAVFALLSGAGRSAAAPFELDAILSLTGSGSFLGQDEAEGLRLVELSVNRSGGIAGRDIHFNIGDDQSSPQVALQLLTQILTKKPAIVIGSTLVAACNAMIPLTTQGTVLYCLSAGFNPPPDSFAFSYGITTTNLIRVNLDYFRARGFKRIAAILTNDATGQDAERGIRNAVALPANSSLQLVALEHYNVTDVSAAAQMSRIKAAAPDALIAYVSGTPLGTVLHGAAEVGLNIPTAVSGANFNYKEMDQFYSFLPTGLFIATVPGLSPSAVPDGPMKRAIGTYVNATKLPGAHGGAQTIVGWDPGTIVVSTLRALGTGATALQIRNYITNLHGYFGACGEYDFRNNPHGLDGNTAVVVHYDLGRREFVPVSRPGGVPLPAPRT